MKRTIVRVFLSAFAFLFALPPVLSCQDPASPTSRLHAADLLTSLDAADVKPWHIKLTVQLFNDGGKPSDEGTIEEWWNGPGIDRREYKTRAYSATEIRSGDNFWRTKDQGTTPYYLELLREQAVHPMPQADKVKSAALLLQKVPLGKVPLDCIILSDPGLRIKTAPVGLFPMYCFDPGKNILRASFRFGQQTILLNRLISFQGKVAAQDVTVMKDKTKVAAAQVATLEMSQAPDAMFALNDDVTTQSLGPVKIGAAVMAGGIVRRVLPVYPEAARWNHVSGVVILRAIIGTDGHIDTLRIASSPDPDLAVAAIFAVQQWTYKPYLLMGKPTEVETTINVNFTFGPAN